MATTSKPGTVQGGDHLPHERDETTETPPPPRKIIEQASSDLERGLVDTDLHGVRGVEQVKPTRPHPGGAAPKRDVRRD
ncbi:hypothetical protein [Rugamonas apoptosis]|uniref:Uncharacterized protein n=1 Tax=Rugamonas apoptosis TaxID=2758570 RepID=A0A7W2FDQ2_9BURK|nr:hypothetical protein [Rugamonas apoptosis]MBA5689694.1 hypothetical protein [Rugamonas apoptosis]